MGTLEKYIITYTITAIEISIFAYHIFYSVFFTIFMQKLDPVNDVYKGS